MKAVQFANYGGPEVLELIETAEPHPEPGQIRVAVRASGVNGLDWKLREGYLKDQMPLQLPAGTGIDVAGIVDEIGPGVDGVRVGDAVFGMAATPALAEFAVLVEWALVPAGLPLEEAGGFGVAAETARRILDLLSVSSGQTLVISGAAGGVGLAAAQFALARGLRVIGTASESSHAFLRELGVEPTSYADGWVDRVRERAPEGIDVALDIAGAGVLPELIALTGDPAAVLSIADFSAPALGARVSTMGAGSAVPALEEAARLWAAGRFRLPVAQTFPLAEAAAAQSANARGHVLGKYVVLVG